MPQFSLPDNHEVVDYQSIGAGIGIVTVGFTTIVAGLKVVFDWLARRRAEKPLYKEAFEQRDEADKRANELWVRNKELEATILQMHQDFAKERSEFYAKFNTLEQELAQARREIAQLRGYMEAKNEK